MTPSRFLRGLSLTALAVAMAGCYGAMQSSPDDVRTFGGLKPSVEDRDAGLVAVAPGFGLKTYRVIAVDKFPVTDPAVKDDDDRRRAAEMATFLQSELVRRLRDAGLFGRVVNLSEAEYRPGQEKTLKLQGLITRLGEGSQAARMMLGAYGAGRARAQAEMQFVDASTGRVLLVTADRRIASVGMWGGSAREHWKESFDDMARDLTKFLVRLSKGEAPKKD
jgi:hypothetical protein